MIALRWLGLGAGLICGLAASVSAGLDGPWEGLFTASCAFLGYVIGYLLERV